MRLVVLGVAPNQAGSGLWASASGRRIAQLSGVEIGAWAARCELLNLTEDPAGLPTLKTYWRSRWWSRAFRECSGASVLALGRRTWEYLAGRSHRSGWLYEPFSSPAESVLVVPHPSGRDRSYNYPDVRLEVGRQLKAYISRKGGTGW